MFVVGLKTKGQLQCQNEYKTTTKNTCTENIETTNNGNDDDIETF
jgi:hypothetical protein